MTSLDSSERIYGRVVRVLDERERLPRWRWFRRWRLGGRLRLHVDAYFVAVRAEIEQETKLANAIYAASMLRRAAR